MRDGPDEQLIEELALIAEIRNVLTRLLEEVEHQQADNQAAQECLERDWSEKKESYAIDSLNASLKNTSPIVSFKPGATRFMDQY